ncbi:hypothetical protein M407DRAFT_241178 [Tulasnella calospora MUT 4182]|uniref:Uncharacterized protein n=1 Tax=Tulasnella calospora MUT 4182 TaxID=1051891 RepID=A0A0C3LGU0_9AGAM|nr:hypothetical protein M407DRAFT_241178 [Tulasnella calospora MUT 4182]
MLLNRLVLPLSPFSLRTLPSPIVPPPSSVLAAARPPSHVSFRARRRRRFATRCVRVSGIGACRSGFARRTLKSVKSCPAHPLAFCQNPPPSSSFRAPVAST